MRLLLLNNNPAVSRLIKLSVDKVGYEMDEFEEYALVPLKSYDLIMVDNESYDEEELKTLCEHSHCGYTIYICQRGSQKPDFTNVSLEKPFLPTDFLTLLEKVKNVITSAKPHEEKEEEGVFVEEKTDPYDIDDIDTFGVDSASMDEISSFEELSLKDEEDSLMTLESPLEEDDEGLDTPTFDLDTKEDDALDLAFIKGNDDTTSEEVGLSEFDFDDILGEEAVEKPTVLEEKQTPPCILDRDDINEVKQLLDDDENEEENDGLLTLEEPVLSETFGWEDKDETLPALEESLKQVDEEEITKEAEDLLMATLPEDQEDDVLVDEVLDETQEEIIDDFQEEIEEKIEEEQIEPRVSVGLSKSLDACMFESLDDLNENAIKRAFGEEVENEITEEISEQNLQEVEVIRGEIESSIAKSLSSLTQSDILKEALKGMRINISITFDEKK